MTAVLRMSIWALRVKFLITRQVGHKDRVQLQLRKQRLRSLRPMSLFCGSQDLGGIGAAEIELFAALELERVIAFIGIAFIILVASFSIVTTLAMSIIEKRKEIAILKTMGARSTGIMKVFLTQGMVVGGLGTLMGGVIGMVTVSGLEHMGLWIPDEVYYIDSLPVHLHR